MDAVIYDDVPRGLEPVSGSIKVVLANGAAASVDDAAYDPATRRLSVAAGALCSGQQIELFFDALVTEEAVGADIGNIAVALGELPSRWQEDGEHPTAGKPFNPKDDLASDWPSVESELERVESPKAYPAGTDEDGGVSRQPEDNGAQDGDEDGKGPAKELPKTIAQEQAAKAAAATSDGLTTVLCTGLALATAAAIALVLSRIRLRRTSGRR